MQSQRVTMHAAGPHDMSQHPPPVADDPFIADNDANDSDQDDDEDKKGGHTKQGRRKIKIEFIADKSRRHITFSKRKAGIMKKAYELSTLTGTQVLLLVVSETGLVYTFTTAKLQPLVTQPEGKNLIQACLNAPGTIPAGSPAGNTSTTTTTRSNLNQAGTNAQTTANIPGGLSIGSASSPPKDDEENPDEEDTNTHGTRAAVGDKRRRRTSASGGAGSRTGNGPASPPTSVTMAPTSLTMPGSAPQGSASQAGAPQAQMSLGSNPTSPTQQHAQATAPQSHYPTTSSGGAASYPPDMYGNPGHAGHMMTSSYQYPPSGSSAPGAPSSAPLSGMGSAGAPHWSQQQYRGPR